MKLVQKLIYVLLGSVFLLSGEWFWMPIPGQALAEGRIAFSSDRDGGPRAPDVYVMDANGENLRNLTNHPAWDANSAWSPDGRWLAFASTRDWNEDTRTYIEIYVMDAEGGNVHRLTHQPGNNTSPAWSPDGQWIAFTSHWEGNEEIYVVGVNGEKARNLTEHPEDDWDAAWSPDGRWIAFSTRRDANAEIYVMDSNGENPEVYNHTREPVYTRWADRDPG